MNTPVSFEIAKLLKEKGFDMPTQRYYEHALTSKKDLETNNYTGSFGWEKGETNLQYGFFRNNGGMADLTNENWYMCSAPIIAEVVMWLYEKHGIWINPQPFVKRDGFVVWLFDIFKDNFIIEQLQPSKGVTTPIEAYEAAIKYTLKKLI
jgi:hypothetical protein